jgi:hypothetical protein
MLTIRSLERPLSDKAGPSVTELLSAVLAFSTLVLGIGAAGYWVLNEKIEKIKKVEGHGGEVESLIRYFEDIQDRQRSFAMLLEKRKATALGFDDPDIKVISLRAGTSFYSSGPASPASRFIVTCSLLRVDGDSAILSINSHVGKSAIEKIEISVPLRPGESAPIAIRGVPGLYVALLDTIRPDVGVFAIGPATPKNKS